MVERQIAQRGVRDPRVLQAMSQHFSFSFDIAGAAYGAAVMGGRYVNPTM